MRTILLAALAVAGSFGFMTLAAAQAPVAVVEEVRGKPAGVEFMDYVAAGKVIKLGPKDTIVLGYMKSCWRETITGGTVVVGAEQSLVHLGEIERVRVDCEGDKQHLIDRQARESAATVFRSLSPAERAATPPRVTIYGLSPIVEVKGAGKLVVERLDKQGERHEVTVGGKSSLLRGRFYDFAQAGKALTPGATYAASFGGQDIVFKVDPGAKAGATPVIGRLLRLE
jgi:hypothetical protein